MEYLSARETAQKWNVSERFVQRRCVEGSVPGAIKFTGAWLIPKDAQKPQGPRKSQSNPSKKTDPETADSEKYKQDILPLINAVFPVGSCREYIETISDPDEKNIATAEYHYYTGSMKKCSDIAEKYLQSDILELRISAMWLYAMSNLSLDKLNNTKKALQFVKDLYDNTGDDSPKQEQAVAICLYNAVITQFHFQKPKGSPETQYFARELPVGLRYYIAFFQAYYAYNNNLFASAVAIAETCIGFEEIKYPIAKVYLHLICAMSYIHMGYKPLSERYLLEALRIAKDDGFLMPFAELHMELCGMLEAVVKKKEPEVFRKIIALAKRYSQGWLKLHNEITGNRLPTDLTPTEYTVAMLIARDWQTKEIALHLGVTDAAAQKYTSEAMEKMGVSKRSEIKGCILPRA